MKNRIVLHAAVLATALTLHTHTAFGQGSLTPPGAPAPTMKSLTEIDAKLEKRTPISSLPCTISTSGSYYLTGNLTTASTAPGIYIQPSLNVTLDLQGFTLDGASVGSHAIYASYATKVTVLNGKLVGWTQGTVQSYATDHTTLRNLECGGAIRVVDPDDDVVGVPTSVVENCVVRTSNINSPGIVLVGRGMVRDCKVMCTQGGSQTAGISCTSGTLENVSVSSHLIGVSTMGPSILSHLNVHDCRLGLDLGEYVKVENSVICGGTVINPGIAGLGNCRVENVLVSGHSVGIQFSNNADVINCTTIQNTRGIELGDGSTVTQCTASNNTQQGIKVGNKSTVQGNTCKSNGVSAIYATGTNNRIEGNHIDANGGVGISLDNASSIVIRNSILNAAGGTIQGSGGPVSGPGIAPVQNPATSTNPNANLAY